MDKGSEGDTILIFACKEIGCEIPSDVVTIGQFTPELFFQIISRSLAAISQGEIKVLYTLYLLFCNYLIV
jgi:GAF domain-containing protein